MSWRSLPLYALVRILLWLGTRDLARSRHHDLRMVTAQARAKARLARARRLAERLDQVRSAGTPRPAGDLLYGSKAIAAHLGVSKSVAVHLIRSRSIPWFPLAGVACARRSTLAAHFVALEDATRPDTRQPPRPVAIGHDARTV